MKHAFHHERPTGTMIGTQRILHLSLLFSLFVLVPQCAHAGSTRLAVSGSQLLLNGQPVKIIRLRCSNALISDDTTDDLIAALDRYRSYGVNTVSVFLMGSRFGDVKGYLPDGSLNPVYRERLERFLRATDQRGMIAIVGCLYWSTSKAKEDLSAWTQDNADGSTSVLRTIKERHDIWQTYNGPPLARDRWESYEVYLFIDNESVDAGGKGRFRVWRDGKLIFDRTDVPTISTADGTIDHLYLFTYWNNENPPTNHLFVDDIVVATSAGPPPNIDASGNTFVGDWMPNQ